MVARIVLFVNSALRLAQIAKPDVGRSRIWTASTCWDAEAAPGQHKLARNQRANLFAAAAFGVRPEVVYLPCEVCPVVAVVGVVGSLVAGVLELDVDEEDVLVVGAVDAGADGGLRFPD
jgi:hypothetical protein